MRALACALQGGWMKNVSTIGSQRLMENMTAAHRSSISRLDGSTQCASPVLDPLEGTREVGGQHAGSGTAARRGSSARAL
jgi:hypothetical protein